MGKILKVSALSKTYGHVHAVDQLTFDVERGQVFGLLGPNGSGKTTTLGMILGVLPVTSGTYEWFDQPGTGAVRRKIGSLIETPNFYPDFTALQHLRLVAINKEVPLNQIEHVLHQVGLSHVTNQRFAAFSLGMKQRLGIASALLGNPSVLVLDEPTNGLDPKGIAEIRSLILRLAQQGKTIILASHLLDEVEKVCTHFAILSKGKLQTIEKVGGVKKSTTDLELASDNITSLRDALKDCPGILSSERIGNKLYITVEGENKAGYINHHAHQRGVLITHLTERNNTLEDIYLQVTK